MKTFPVDKNPFPVSSSTSGFLVPFDLPPASYSPKGMCTGKVIFIYVVFTHPSKSLTSDVPVTSKVTGAKDPASRLID